MQLAPGDKKGLVTNTHLWLALLRSCEATGKQATGL